MDPRRRNNQSGRNAQNFQQTASQAVLELLAYDTENPTTRAYIERQIINQLQNPQSQNSTHQIRIPMQSLFGLLLGGGLENDLQGNNSQSNNFGGNIDGLRQALNALQDQNGWLLPAGVEVSRDASVPLELRRQAALNAYIERQAMTANTHEQVGKTLDQVAPKNNLELILKNLGATDEDFETAAKANELESFFCLLGQSFIMNPVKIKGTKANKADPDVWCYYEKETVLNAIELKYLVEEEHRKSDEEKLKRQGKSPQNLMTPRRNPINRAPLATGEPLPAPEYKEKLLKYVKPFIEKQLLLLGANKDQITKLNLSSILDLPIVSDNLRKLTSELIEKLLSVLPQQKLESFFCPLTKKIIFEPVRLRGEKPNSWISFEREALEKEFNKNPGVNPITKKLLIIEDVDKIQYRQLLNNTESDSERRRYYCAITKKEIKDPVQLKNDNVNYFERAALEEALKRNPGVHPVTKQRLDMKFQLAPDPTYTENLWDTIHAVQGNADKLAGIQEYINKLKAEKNSSTFFKSRKQHKIEAFVVLGEALHDNGVPVNVSIKGVIEVFPDVEDGVFSHRARDLIDEIRERFEDPVSSAIDRYIQTLENECRSSFALFKSRKTDKIKAFIDLKDKIVNQEMDPKEAVDAIKQTYPNVAKGIFSHRARDFLDRIANGYVVDSKNVRHMIAS